MQEPRPKIRHSVASFSCHLVGVIATALTTIHFSWVWSIISWHIKLFCYTGTVNTSFNSRMFQLLKQYMITVHNMHNHITVINIIISVTSSSKSYSGSIHSSRCLTDELDEYSCWLNSMDKRGQQRFSFKSSFTFNYKMNEINHVSY